MTRWVWLATFFAGLAACGPSLPKDFERARSEAVRAYAHGRYEAAAGHWARAAELADSNYHRNEAWYRQAASLSRAGRHEEASATLGHLLAEAPKSDRAPRAAYDRADLEIDHGDPEEGHRMLERIIHRYPRSSSAQGALHRHLQRLEQTSGRDAMRAYLERSMPKLDRTPLAEQAHYTYARVLEADGQTRAARDRYVYVADRFGYPKGRYWDDALLAASKAEEKLGDYRAAVRVLRRMLTEREPSHLQGSYERPRYSEAQYRIAELYRDHLSDPAKARREFRRLWDRHETSLLRDDAKWNEARLASEAGDERGACRALQALRKAYPESRYVPCAHHLCSDAKRSDRDCRSYIERELGSER